MVGELVTETVGPAVMEAPMAAAEIVGGVTSVVPEVIETPLSVPPVVSGAGSALGSLSPVMEATSEATAAVQEGIGVLSEVGNIVSEAASLPESMTPIGELHMYLRQNDAAGALEFLAYGKFDNMQGFSKIGAEQGLSLDAALSDLQKMLPKNAQTVLGTVQNLNIPDGVRNDPEFLEQFMKELQQSTKASELENGDKQDVGANIQAMIEESAQKAVAENAASRLTDKDLEKLKKEAAKKTAMEAIRQYMNTWRASVVKDAKLDERSQQHALRRIDLVEKRLLTKEAIKHDGFSIMKIIALATVMIQEMQEESLPQPKL